MAKSRKEIQKQSNAKRGVKNKAFLLPLETIDLINQMAQEKGISGAKLVVLMTDHYHQCVRGGG